MPVFHDSENISGLLPDGDYKFCIVQITMKISSGPATAGSEQFEVTFEIEPSGKPLREQLIDHKSCHWKWDVLIKSCGISLIKGEPYDLRESKAAELGIKWVNLVGRRGWCRLTSEAGSRDVAKKYNRIGTFYTDKERLEPRLIEAKDEDDVPF